MTHFNSRARRAATGFDAPPGPSAGRLGSNLLKPTLAAGRRTHEALPADGVAACVLYVVLAGAELELAPESIAGHPAIRTTAKELNRKGTEVLLDQNVHAAAIRSLPDGANRGRPDLVQYPLLVLLESPLNKEGSLKVFVHTRHGELLNIRADTRLPRSEARFQGLLSKVLRDGASQDKQPLLWSDGERTPAQVLAECKGPTVRVGDGPLATPAHLAQRAENGNLTLILAASATGDPGPAWRAAVGASVSLFTQPLQPWAIAAEVVAAVRAASSSER